MPDEGIQPQGTLELTWTNKRRRLIESVGGTYDYSWVEPSDYRVAEIRLLHDAALAGDPSDRDRVRDNLLIRGDALHALRSLTALPEYVAEFAGQVKLAYLDPPFNTGKVFEHYEDSLEHSIWLTMMRDRLRQIDRLLAPDGSIWVHCDDSEQAYLKVLMDEVFTRDNFVAVVVWEKADSPRMDAKRFSSSHDYIIVYAKSAAWGPNRLAAGADTRKFPYVAVDGRRYNSAPRENGARAPSARIGPSSGTRSRRLQTSTTPMPARRSGQSSRMATRATGAGSARPTMPTESLSNGATKAPGSSRTSSPIRATSGLARP